MFYVERYSHSNIYMLFRNLTVAWHLQVNWKCKSVPKLCLEIIATYACILGLLEHFWQKLCSIIISLAGCYIHVVGYYVFKSVIILLVLIHCNYWICQSFSILSLNITVVNGWLAGTVILISHLGAAAAMVTRYSS